MVYGFARQSGGQVRIYSEVGKGTTMCLYLPRSLGEAIREPPPSGDDRGARAADGEDRARRRRRTDVRMLVTEVLEELGYRRSRRPTARAGLADAAIGRSASTC